MAAKPKKDPSPKTLLGRIRPELNVEKWSIWQPANARTGPPRERVIEREITLPDDNRVTAKLTVAPTTKGDLTTRDQRVYYALVKHWEERGRKPDFTPFSMQALARHLKMPWGQTTLDSLRASLSRLRATYFEWEQAFEDKTTGRVLSLLDTFNLLSDLKIVRTKDDGKVNREVGYFRFNDAVLKNLLVKHTKPILFDVVLSFKGEIAQILYTHLDLILADKMKYERRTKELFEDLGLEGKAYKNLSDRKRALARALPELEGKPVTTGKILSAKLEPTKGGADFKLVVRKGKATVAIAQEAQEESKEHKADVIALPVQSQEAREAKELVRHFHRLFFGAQDSFPTGRALDQAATLIARHGANKALHIVEFAHREAPKTKFKAATFGAVMQYEGRAVKDFEDQEQAKRRQLTHKRAEEAKRQREAAQVDSEQRAFRDFWDGLTEEQRQAFEAEALRIAESSPEARGLFGLYRNAVRRDPQSPSANSYRFTILLRHFEETRSNSAT
jgi:hypothetical protein